MINTLYGDGISIWQQPRELIPNQFICKCCNSKQCITKHIDKYRKIRMVQCLNCGTPDIIPIYSYQDITDRSFDINFNQVSNNNIYNTDYSCY